MDLQCLIVLLLFFVFTSCSKLPTEQGRRGDSVENAKYPNHSFLEQIKVKNSDLYRILSKRGIRSNESIEKTLEICFEKSDTIVSLEGMEYFKKLKKFESYHCEIEDISPLSSLVNLEIIYIIDASIKSIHCLFNLRKLKELSLYINPNLDGDLISLKRLINLKSLDLGLCKLRSIEVLESLKNLEVLYLSQNEIRYISVLRQLQKLKVLNLSSNQIEDIGALHDLNRLKYLWIKGNKISKKAKRKFAKNLNKRVDWVDSKTVRKYMPK